MEHLTLTGLASNIPKKKWQRGSDHHTGTTPLKEEAMHKICLQTWPSPRVMVESEFKTQLDWLELQGHGKSVCAFGETLPQLSKDSRWKYKVCTFSTTVRGSHMFSTQRLRRTRSGRYGNYPDLILIQHELKCRIISNKYIELLCLHLGHKKNRKSIWEQHTVSLSLPFLERMTYQGDCMYNTRDKVIVKGKKTWF